MKKFSTLFVFLVLHMLTHAQGGVWTWVKGSDTLNDPGNRGAKGVSNVANYPFGRYQAAQWTDLNGNFWIFGGLNPFGASFNLCNDLWMYNPSTNVWTWVNGPDSINGRGIYGTKGIPGPNNIPGARYYGARSWTDKTGKLWMQGGSGFDGLGSADMLDDVWMYDIATNEWTWMAGSDSVNAIPVYGTILMPSDSNNPGARGECNTAWVKSDGSLWLFGGVGYNNRTVFNDVWKFDISANEWIWMSGDSTSSSYNYGSLDVESPTNLPSARCSYTHWQDGKDNFYIFSGYDSSGTSPNDIWKYNTANYEWTWIGGDTIPNGGNVFVQLCEAGNGTLPSSRLEHRSTQANNCSDIFWMFGGWDNLGVSNDLWIFNNQSSDWTWVSGSETGNPVGSYGIINVANSSNAPPGRKGECFWADQSGALWVWGGCDYLENGYNDMWKFVPDTSCIHPNVIAAPTISRTGSTLTTSGGTTYQWQLNGVNIIGDTTASIIIRENGSYTVIATNSAGCSSSASITITNTGINSVNNTDDIGIYPNPARQSCTISISNYNGENYTAHLTDMTGKDVSAWSFAGNSYTFSVSAYASGVYILQISDSDERKTMKKLVVE